MTKAEFDAQVLADLLDMEVCFWLDEDGKPCPRCGRLHMGTAQ